MFQPLLYVYIGITLSVYKVTQHPLKINMEWCTKCRKCFCAKYRNPPLENKKRLTNGEKYDMINLLGRKNRYEFRTGFLLCWTNSKGI